MEVEGYSDVLLEVEEDIFILGHRAFNVFFDVI